MKKILGLIAVSLLASLASPPAALAAYWIQVGESQYGRNFVDANSVQRQGPFVRYWILIDYFTPDHYGNTSALDYETTDCRNGNYKLRRLVTYSGDRMTSDYTYGGNNSVRQVVPGSVGELTFKAVCSQ